MTDPFLDSLATALATQAATTLTEAGKKALASVRDLVRGKLSGDPESEKALEAADDRPAGHPTITALAQRLDEVARADPEFGERLRQAGEPVHREMSAGDGGVVNEVSGNVTGNVVQGRDFHGDISL